MNRNNEMLTQLQRYYALWKECNDVYEEWARAQGLSVNSLWVLYSCYDDSKLCTQKTISQTWNIPKQTVNTILKDFSERGLVEMTSIPKDKRNKQLRLTPAGNAFADEVIGKLRARELYVLEKMGLERITDMNDQLMLFIRLFSEGGLTEDE